MSKRILFFFFAAILAATPSMLRAESELAFEPFTGQISGSRVRVRTSPSLESHIVSERSNGEMVSVVGEDTGFYAVRPAKGTKGYVFRTFVLDGVIEGERVNVRLYPDIEAPVIARLNTGDKVDAVVSSVNNKWLEVDLQNAALFYVAKEYIENIGLADLIAQMEQRSHEASHLLSSATLYAQSELQKPFEEVDLEGVYEKFESLVSEYGDLPAIAEKAHEVNQLVQEAYIQKKIAFLEGRAEEIDMAKESPLRRLAVMRRELRGDEEEAPTTQVNLSGEAAASTVGLSAVANDSVISEQMLVWEPLEESIYHLWAAANADKTMDEFYAEEELEAAVLTGVIETYSRPVKHRPGDFLLKSGDRPVAFLYSTKVNLHDLVGQKVTLVGAPRSNNNFAYPAYFVLSAE